MAKLLFNIGRWSYLHKKLVAIVWLCILGTVAGVSLTAQKGFNDIFAVTGVPSEQATELLKEKWPGSKTPAASTDVNLVFRAPEGHTLDEPEYMEAMDKTVEAIYDNVEHLGDTKQFGNPVRVNENFFGPFVQQMRDLGLPEQQALSDAYTLRTWSDDKRYGFANFTYDNFIPADVSDEDREAVVDAVQFSRDAGLTVEIGGPGFAPAPAIEPISEVVGLIAAALILLLFLGSFVAAGMPVLTGLVGVAIGSLSAAGATFFLPLNSLTPALGLMIGLACGIDYALFILTRYRDELSRGRSRPDAVGLATGTAGSAVVFAGMTVILALVALRLVDIAFLTYLGYFAALYVFVGVLVALTLLPALIGFAGNRLFRKEVAIGYRKKQAAAVGVAAHGAAGTAGHSTEHGSEEAGSDGAKDEDNGLGTRWAKFVWRNPLKVLLVCVIGLGLLAVPAFDLKLALPSDSVAKVDTTNRRSVDLIEEGFGAGRNARMLVIVKADHVNRDSVALRPYIAGQVGVEPQEAAQKAAFLYTMEQMATNPEVVHSQFVGVSPDGTTAQIMVTPKGGPTDQSTIDLIFALRAKQNEIESAIGVDMGITGFTAIQQDVTDRLAQTMITYLILVVGLSLVLLVMVFRSLVMPLIAAFGYLLSVGAAFGVTVLVWQKGALGLWDSPGPLISFMPIFLIGVTFGLAMDYQVFIASRMRERYIHESHRAAQGTQYSPVDDSVIFGFSLGAKVVTAAGLIMVCVFAAAVLQPLAFIQVFGFALGAGVLFDAFVVRMAVVPALMILFGRATWYMPKWLDKILPSFDVEGSGLETAFAKGEVSYMEDDTDWDVENYSKSYKNKQRRAREKARKRGELATVGAAAEAVTAVEAAPSSLVGGAEPAVVAEAKPNVSHETTTGATNGETADSAASDVLTSDVGTVETGGGVTATGAEAPMPPRQRRPIPRSRRSTGGADTASSGGGGRHRKPE